MRTSPPRPRSRAQPAGTRQRTRPARVREPPRVDGHRRLLRRRCGAASRGWGTRALVNPVRPPDAVPRPRRPMSRAERRVNLPAQDAAADRGRDLPGRRHAAVALASLKATALLFIVRTRSSRTWSTRWSRRFKRTVALVWSILIVYVARSPASRSCSCWWPPRWIIDTRERR